MRARLYRGPHDGKVLEVPDHQHSIRLMRPKDRHVSRSDGSDWWFSIATIDDEYRRVMITNHGTTTWCYHPDGSTYFEWTQKRGTRIER